ncbi:MAG: glycosyltransferase, partial [Clostridia bacterium]|nr:glycosyltransferase [Clostridia bacterium]
MGYKYKFSIVMPVYNVSEFIEYAVDSVIAQSIGFNNVQLILVDDGSTDNSGELCDRYKACYPENVFVIHKENGGLSTARNAGLLQAEGKYVNFMDPDDHIPK